LISPTIDIACTGESLYYNCWGDQGEGSGDVAWASSCAPTSEERKQDCEWGYLKYMFGLPVSRHVHSAEQAHEEYMARPASFWSSPKTNPLEFDYSIPGFPSTFVVVGEAEVFAEDGANLAERMCVAGVDVDHYTPPGMWHDFVEYSDGCGNAAGVPLSEGREAYRRIGIFIEQRRVTTQHLMV